MVRAWLLLVVQDQVSQPYWLCWLAWMCQLAVALRLRENHLAR